MATGFAQITGDASMDDATSSFIQMLNFCFEDLEDPRVQASCDHLLIDILTIAILAVTCGADDWTGMETFWKRSGNIDTNGSKFFSNCLAEILHTTPFAVYWGCWIASNFPLVYFNGHKQFKKRPAAN